MDAVATTPGRGPSIVQIGKAEEGDEEEADEEEEGEEEEKEGRGKRKRRRGKRTRTRKNKRKRKVLESETKTQLKHDPIPPPVFAEEAASRIKAMELEIGELTHQCASLEELRVGAAREKEAQESAIASLHERMAGMVDTIRASEGALAEAKASNVALEASLAEARARVATLEDQLHASQAECDRQKDNLSKVMASFLSAKTKKDEAEAALRADLDAAHAATAAAQSECAVARQQAADAQERARRAEAAAAAAAAVEESSRLACEQLRRDLAAVKGKCVELAEVGRTLQVALREKSTECETLLERAKSEREAAVARERESVDAVEARRRAEVAAAEAEAEAKKREGDRLKVELFDAERTIAALRAELATAVTTQEELLGLVEELQRRATELEAGR